MVKRYSLSKDGNTYLSTNFKVREFRCKDGSDEILISPETVGILQSIRDYFCQPITITSAYRTPSHNAAVGGASSSQHVKGTAVDFKVQGVPPTAVASFIEKFFPVTGCGLYSTFVHVDTRGYKVRWKNKGSNTVSSFGLGNLYEDYKCKEECELSYGTFLDYMSQYYEDVADLDGSDWSSTEREWALENGIVVGDADGSMRWRSNITREEAVIMLYRLYNLLHTEG